MQVAEHPSWRQRHPQMWQGLLHPRLWLRQLWRCSGLRAALMLGCTHCDTWHAGEPAHALMLPRLPNGWAGTGPS